ncbi:hypothetical protein O181_056801 [Austropuccinia psidii MF-1]|uniref:tRNA (adenine(58)-N(1))-methyltransferase catalytic subunit TRM61 n=1 Tax=Austropuccinia psidii MF-1 TaxID=1389203 RepID=A0A9Q3EDX7_9BASI|nr:hypothetical protein [Austropuccinia psidii MF-1]
MHLALAHTAYARIIKDRACSLAFVISFHQMDPSKPSRSIFTIDSGKIQAGDTVIVYHSRDNLSSIVVTPGQQLSSRFGEFLHESMIGMPFGSKCASRKGNGFTYLLRPTPELWTLALPHRTQILYHPDISFITSQLDIKPGSFVLEAGTGSGSFSHSIARTIGPHGKLLSFEFHEERYHKAITEFEAHGLLSTVGGPISLAHRNVIRDGFGDLGNSALRVDSVFLDLPAPWDALEDVKRLMNPSQISRICCFSPCIEQVQKTCQTLASLGFSDLVMFETLVRTHEPVTTTMAKVDDAVKRIKEVEIKKEARREKQISEAKRRKQLTKANVVIQPDSNETHDKRKVSQDPEDSNNHISKKPRTEIKEENPRPEVKEQSPRPGIKEESPRPETKEESPRPEIKNESPRPENKKESLRPENKEESSRPEIKEQSPRPGIKTQAPHPEIRVESRDNGELNGRKPPPIKAYNPNTLETCKPAGMTRGHTSFLTFATLLPKPLPSLTNDKT